MSRQEPALLFVGDDDRLFEHLGALLREAYGGGLRLDRGRDTALRLRRAEEALSRSEERYHLLFESVPMPMYVYDVDTFEVLDVNQTMLLHYGYTRDEFLALKALDFRPPEDVPRLREWVGAHRDEPYADVTGWRHVKKDGSIIDVEIRSNALQAQGRPARLVLIRDVTEQRRAEAALARLSKRLIDAQEAERRRLARALHDEVGQALTALKMGLQAGAAADPAARAALDEEGRQIVDQLIAQVRDLSLDLRPSMLDDLGLVPALRWYLDRLGRRAGIDARLAADPPDIRAPAAVETACFRIAQEALTNVTRHASARHAWVELRREGDELALTVGDDGAGFEVDRVRERAARGAGLGLLGMSERAALLGGRVEVTSAPGAGTRVRAVIPIAPAVTPDVG